MLNERRDGARRSPKPCAGTTCTRSSSIPVMVATSGDSLMVDGMVAALRAELLPLADLVTPNLPEAARLLDQPLAANEDEMMAQATGAALRSAARRSSSRAATARGQRPSTFSCERDGETLRLALPRIDTRNTHGTGCTFSAAVAALPRARRVAGGRCGGGQALRPRGLAGGRRARHRPGHRARSIICTLFVCPRPADRPEKSGFGRCGRDASSWGQSAITHLRAGQPSARKLSNTMRLHRNELRGERRARD